LLGAPKLMSFFYIVTLTTGDTKGIWHYTYLEHVGSLACSPL